MINRKEEIKRKGFEMSLTNERTVTDFSKIKVGIKSLDDAVYRLGELKAINPRLADKKTVLNAMQTGDVATMREISNFFFKTSGIYQRMCKYMAYLYMYDWFVTPYISKENVKKDQIVEIYKKALLYLDNFNAKKFFGNVALKVLRNGCYYGYLIPKNDTVAVQELPPDYCRSRYSINDRPAVEFNMKYFDDAFQDSAYRMRILDLFPKEFKKGYQLYKQGKLSPDFSGDTAGWYLLDVQSTVKFNMNGEDYPSFIQVIPAIIDLDAAQDLDRKKMAQQLLKIIIQKMPLDKNGELLFDVDEAKELHNNAVKMLGRAIGLDVLTTFADVEVADMADRNTSTTVDELKKVERTVYNEGGISENLFNSDGNIATDKSVINDEAAMLNLISQFEDFLNLLLTPFNKNPKKIYFKAQILKTTIYNYKELAKLYKEQMQLGYSKFLSQIALGQSQSSILANAYFENDMLDLINVFIPPLMSSTMNPEILNKNKTGENEVGRKEKEDSQKSDKTLKNIESMG